MQENEQPPVILTLSATGKLHPHDCVGAPVETFHSASPSEVVPLDRVLTLFGL